MNSKINKLFVWIKNRCIFKYQETNNSSIIQHINSIARYLEDIESLNITEKDLNTIIGKYYFDFHMQKSNDSDGFEIGFSEKDRQLLRHNIKLICNDIVQSLLNKNFDDKYSNTLDTQTTTIFDETNIEHLIGSST